MLAMKNLIKLCIMDAQVDQSHHWMHVPKGTYLSSERLNYETLMKHFIQQVTNVQADMIKKPWKIIFRNFQLYLNISNHILTLNYVEG